MSLLEVHDLGVIYPNKHHALTSINFTADAGQIVAVIGRSGAGKSTLLRCINGLQRPTSGMVVLDGRTIVATDEQQLRRMRREIGFIWQGYNLIERLSVMTNVLMGRLGYSDGLRSCCGYFDRSHREIAVHNLERVNLLDKARQRADRLSGGEKQRVAIARAISQEPKVILADEPVASLDPELAVHVLSDLSRVAREDGVLTLINIHHVELARQFADRIIGIAQGRVVFDGRPTELNDAVLHRVYRFDKPFGTQQPRTPELVQMHDIATSV
jgi:phosphonate transport system ATP-binding protein